MLLVARPNVEVTGVRRQVAQGRSVMMPDGYAPALRRLPEHVRLTGGLGPCAAVPERSATRRRLAEPEAAQEDIAPAL
jgi:hypothetical protein